MKKSLEDDLRELREERAAAEKAGTLKREIDRHHKFPFNENPNDPDAHPDSGWLYAKTELEPVRPAGPPILGRGGPDAGLNCQIEGCPHRLRIIDEFRPGEILEYVSGGERQPVRVEGNVNILILACPNNHQVQMRSDCMPRASNLYLP